MGEDMKVYRVLMGKPEERDHSDDRGLDGIRMDLRKIGRGFLSRFSWLRIGAGCGLL
jgi:hypothetical protein